MFTVTFIIELGTTLKEKELEVVIIKYGNYPKAKKCSKVMHIKDIIRQRQNYVNSSCFIDDFTPGYL